MKKYVFNFPACIVEEDTRKQVRHVVKEAKEAKSAIRESDERLIEELLDVIHAAETELRKHDKSKVDAIREDVRQNFALGIILTMGDD